MNKVYFVMKYCVNFAHNLSQTVYKVHIANKDNSNLN